MSDVEGKQVPTVDENTIIHRHTKIVHAVFGKMRTLVLSTRDVVGEHNASLLLARIMRELNKHSLYGFEKKTLAICIMVLLLDAVGCPHTASQLTAEAISELIEFIYTANMHRYKKQGKCVIL